MICQTCAAQLAPSPVAEQMHSRWHDTIAQVAIESTKRIEQRVQELEAGYGDQ